MYSSKRKATPLVGPSSKSTTFDQTRTPKVLQPIAPNDRSITKLLSMFRQEESRTSQSAVHFKFKSVRDSETVKFDGLAISVADLRASIFAQKRIGKSADFELKISNAETKEEYVDDQKLIPKNTSLEIARVPIDRRTKKHWNPSDDKQQNKPSVQYWNPADYKLQNKPNAGDKEAEKIAIDLTHMAGTEEDKINAMMIQSTIDYNPRNYQKIRGTTQTGAVPAKYRCNKCSKSGHWIKDCALKTSQTTVKRTTGIPRSFIEAQKKISCVSNNAEPPSAPLNDKPQEVPANLLCPLCKDMFTDALMISCCGTSFCDACIRTALTESEDNECPDCHEKGPPDSLFPNRYLRNAITTFTNKTGYSKARRETSGTKAPAKIMEKPATTIVLVSGPKVEIPTVDKQDVCASRQQMKTSRSDNSNKHNKIHHNNGHGSQQENPRPFVAHHNISNSGNYPHSSSHLPLPQQFQAQFYYHQQPNSFGYQPQPEPFIRYDEYAGGHSFPPQQYQHNPSQGYPPMIDNYYSHGTAIVDDTLGAFNRYMAEKDRRQYY